MSLLWSGEKLYRYRIEWHGSPFDSGSMVEIAIDESAARAQFTRFSPNAVIEKITSLGEVVSIKNGGR